MIVLVKLSILALYLRLFSRVHKTFTKFCYCVIGLTIAWGVATLFSAAFQCHPVRAMWEAPTPTNYKKKCFDTRRYMLATNAPNVILNLVVLVLPLHPIWQLQLPTKKRLMIIGMLWLGSGYVEPGLLWSEPMQRLIDLQ